MLLLKFVFLVAGQLGIVIVFAVLFAGLLALVMFVTVVAVVVVPSC